MSSSDVSARSLRSDDPVESLGWLHYVRRSGPEGTRWSQEYEEVQELEVRSFRALVRLREGALAEGGELLGQLDAEVRARRDLRPSIHHVLERFYQGLLAFWYYRRGDLDGATAGLDRAHAAVVSAIARQRFLLPLANHCHEFRLHQARVERSRRCWAAMWGHIRAVEAMMENRRPLCRLPESGPIYYSSLVEFFQALPGGLGRVEEQDLQGLVEPRRRLQLFDRFTRGILAFPGFVIPCP